MPPACNVGFASASPVDFGSLPHRGLAASGTLLLEKHTTLDITCGGPTLLAFTAKENRPNSAITQQEATAQGMPWPYQNPINAARHVWGLGRIDDIKIGAMVVLIRPQASLINGKPPVANATRLLARPIGSASTWPVQSAEDTINLNTVDEYSFGTPTAAVPISTASVSLGVLPLLNKSTALPSTKEIPIDGSVTFTLRYL